MFLCITETVSSSRAFIFFDVDALHKSLSRIQFYERNALEYRKFLSEPILANDQETIQKHFSWDETVGNGMLKSLMRKMVGTAIVIKSHDIMISGVFYIFLQLDSPRWMRLKN
jgi:hypothetical protein